MSEGASLHNSGAGIREHKLNAGVYSYTSELAKYLSCASTVRARVKDMFGHSPDVTTIKKMQDEHKRSRDRYRKAWDALGERPSDSLHWVASAKKAEPSEELTLAPIRRATLPRDIITDIAGYYGLTYDDVTGKKRTRAVIKPRRLAAYVLVKRGNSMAQTGRWLGGRDHTTVMCSIEQFEHQATEDERKLAAFYIGDRCK